MADTKPRKIVALERKAQAVALRKQGKTYEEIGRIMQMHHANVFALVKSAMEEMTAQLKEDTIELRAMEEARLDEMYAAIHPRIVKGDCEAIKTGLLIMARRARQRGSDEPAETKQIHVFDQRSDEELRQEARRLGIPVEVPNNEVG